MAIDARGRIVVAGKVIIADRAHFAPARYNTDGSLDTSFSGDGKVTTQFIAGGGAEANGLAIDANGLIVAGGWAAEWGNPPPG